MSGLCLKRHRTGTQRLSRIRVRLLYATPLLSGNYPTGIVFPDEFVENVARLSPDVTSPFIEAALSMVEDGYNPNARVIAEGAIRDIEAFEKVVALAVELRKETFGKRRRGPMAGGRKWRIR